MAKTTRSKVVQETKKTPAVTAVRLPTMAVTDGDKRSSEQLMKLPKGEIVRHIAIPENISRFVVDLDNRSKQGKSIIALMESLRDGNAAAIKAVTEILGSLAGMVGKK